MKQFTTLAALLPLVAAHGFIKSPTPRKPGNAFKAACGEQPYYQQSSDINGNVQGILQVVGSSLDSANCNLWLCKGFQFEDNSASVQSYALGQTIPFEITIAAPHTGIANVSVVKTSSNTIIGQPLIEFDNYASNSGIPANNTAFSVTLPSDLSGECTTAGDCVLQWYWDAHNIDQTYEACVDFTVGGGSGSSPSPSSAVASSAAPTQTIATSSAAQTPVATTSAALSQAPTSAAVTPVPGSSTTPGSSQPTTTPGDDDECEDDGADDDTGNQGDDECEDEGDDTNTGDDDECEDEGDDTGSSPVTSSAAAAASSAPAATAVASSSKQSVVAQPTSSTVFVTVTAQPTTVTVTAKPTTVTVTAQPTGQCS
ncbi:hypothetical protein V2G26_009245 [Clonostachys chloroleuca]|uniref:Chitin-binding type-4 domain-containing protein n=1 Tax=Clonostachys chloroleuca TaxID=1926264 RepID=A0AA35LZ42_9HYPO|nr:unnamed protein product [Clonostachys chloroleuca]